MSGFGTSEMRPCSARLITACVVFAGLFSSQPCLSQEIHSLQHEAVLAAENVFLQVDSDTYLLAYQDDDLDGFLKTFTISADGSTITEAQSLEYDTDRGMQPSMVRVDTDTFAIAYRGPGNDGFIKTFTVPADGSSITEVQSLEHETVLAYNFSLVQVDADTYLLGYTADGDVGMIKTFTISADGSTITQVQSLEHDSEDAVRSSLFKIDADTFALAYSSTAQQDGIIKTFTIPADGSSITEVQSITHDVGFVQRCSPVQVDVDTFALAYTSSLRASLKTFNISADGTSIVEVQSLEHDADNGAFDSIVQVDGDTFAVAYRGGSSITGFLKSFTVSADGTSIVEVQSLEHDAVSGNYNSLVHVSGDTYALAYGSTGGIIKTFTIGDDGALPVALTNFTVE